MSHSRNLSLLVAAMVALAALASPAVSRADAPRISYDLSMPDPAAHVFSVSMRIDDLSRPTSVVRMPIWIPGYYSDDQYGRNAYDFQAQDAMGHALSFTRDGQSAYVVDTQGVSSFAVTYRLFADRRADIGTQLAADRAVFNGAETFMYLQGDDGYPAPGAVSLQVHPPDGWRIESGLLAMETAPNTFVAPSYDVMVDCPTMIAPHFAIANFSVNNVPYHLVIDGIGDYDVNKLAVTAQQIIGSEVKMMGHAGYHEYWALFLAGSGGGMEHLNSTISGMAAFGWDTPPNPDVLFGANPWDNFGLVLAHEHFHSWNVKRIRPAVLGPFRYDQEVHTRRLDVAEGFTEYYTFVHEMRSGFTSPKGTWGVFADDIQTEENNPGRKTFSLGDLSWNTWWGSDDPFVDGGDYYDGAAVMAFMLDLKIRHDSSDAHSIDDVMRYLFADWEAKSLNQFQSPGGTYADDALPSIIEKATADADAGLLFHTWWDTTQLPDWNTYLQYAGLKLVRTMPKPGTATLDADWTQIGAPMGVGFRPRTGKLNYGFPTVNPDEIMLTRVMPGGAAEKAGLESFDVLLSFDGLAATQNGFPSMLATHHAGERVPVTLMRDGRVFSTTITLGQDHQPDYSIEPRHDATPAEQQLLKDYEAGVPFGK